MSAVRHRPTPRGRYRWISGLLVLAAVIAAGRGFGEEEQFAELLRSARPAWLLALAALQIGTYVLLASAWTIAIRRAGAAPPRRTALVRVALAELFTDQAVPSGGVGGMLLVVRALQRRSVPGPAASAAVVTSLLGLYVAQVAAVVASTVVLVVRHRVSHFAVVVAGVACLASIAIPVVVVAAAVGGLPRLPERLQRMRVVRTMRAALGAPPRAVVQDPRTMAPVAALRLSIMGLDGASIAVAAAAFGRPIAVDEAIAAFVFASVAGSLSFVPGALGTFEALATGLLTLFGAPVELAFASVLLMRAFSFWLPMAPGLWFARRELATTELPTEARPEGSLPLGLSEDEAALRLEHDGPNEPSARRDRASIGDLLRRFANPLVLILVLASIASAVLHDFGNAAVIIAIVGISVVVEFVQTHRADRAARRLKATVAPTATVLRGGTWRELARREVVWGDVVRVSAGDMVPADARILEARDLHVNEAAMTGEPMPAERSKGEGIAMGSSVVSGNATAVVTATGARTAFGAIAASLAARAGPTEFERGVVRFGALIGKTVVFLVLFVVVAAVTLHREPFEALLFALALAVGLTPEFLPMITTVTLTRGAVRMARANVIVKNLAAIQNFGSMDVLCSDKTGTLTTGEMTLEAHVDPGGGPSERPLLLAYVNSFFESGIDNPVDAALREKGKLERVAPKHRVDPLDVAVLRHEHPDIHGYAKLDEIPFDFERRRVSVVVVRDGAVMLVTKGAPEHVMSVATAYERDGVAVPLDDEARARCRATSEGLMRRGLRVLAVAARSLDTPAPYHAADEERMVLAGFLAFADPPREDARETLASLGREGVHVKVLTGDSEVVARDICARVGLPTRHVLTGAEVDAMTDEVLAHGAERTHVFARVTPAQKGRILRALRGRGHVVGFLGDGINDAPSLHAADVGISVANATDVAKEAAAVILLEPGLRVLRDGVLEGRRAFGNVMKYLLMGTSSNFGNMFSMAASAVFLPFLPMLPKQILLNSFLYDLAQLTIPYDHVDAHFVRKPRRWNIDLLRRFMLFIGPISSIYDLLTFWFLLRVFAAPAPMFHTGWFVESLATQTLVIFVIRTGVSPLASRPSRPLVATVLAVVAFGIVLPFTGAARWFGFVPLPPAFFLFLVPAVLTYLGLVEVAKRRLLRRSL